MSENEVTGSIFGDGLEALKLVFRLTWRRNLMAWLYVPIGILIMLIACFGVSSVIGLSSVTFPASVALLVVLFLILIICEIVIGDRKTKALVKIIDIPAGWALRYISLFFTPSFVLLPLSPPISGVEVGKIIAVFLIGFVVILAFTAWITRGLQLIMGSSKRAITERAEEMGDEDDSIPFADISQSQHDSVATLNSTMGQSSVEPTSDNPVEPPRAQDPSQIRVSGGPPETDITSASVMPLPQITQTPLPLSRPQRWAYFVNLNFDRLTYLVLFLFIGIPVYYSTRYAMPLHLTSNILAYFAALSLPARWRQLGAHPVLVSAGVTIFGIWILGLIRGDQLKETLEIYKTGTNYLSLWHGPTLPLPGAGDIFSSALDASIVALALPMFAYRSELHRHFFAIVIPNITVSVASLFGYPVLCSAIGISAERSLAFAARSLTLALATPAVKNLGGDVNTGAALAIMSGILGVLIGNRVLGWLRIPEDDYVTRGVTLGANSSAIATALLLYSDPRAAALSCLSMSLFGIITLALSSVPPIVTAIQSLVNL